MSPLDDPIGDLLKSMSDLARRAVAEVRPIVVSIVRPDPETLAASSIRWWLAVTPTSIEQFCCT